MCPLAISGRIVLVSTKTCRAYVRHLGCNYDLVLYKLMTNLPAEPRPGVGGVIFLKTHFSEGVPKWSVKLTRGAKSGIRPVVVAAVAALAFVSSAYKTGASGSATATANATSEKSAQSAARRLLLLLSA